ncbi:hypothetical protein H0274_14510 [Altererythrobacter sp. CC-YST694]|uniref:hypothetical protein n=1 Tax=Altererythrobacter sp. CC-YST694 TaxID=2755038 RepID=UPI001D003744|nr:hypothetical protein [Altererythrobacter sp. CC-YST694]MCB5426474.1 hypothetical protein [Altererythrobacter sp. CC-YST694]
MARPISRRHFIASTSIIAAAGAVPAARLWQAGATGDAALFVSAEHAPAAGLPANAVVFDGPRIERLQAMAASLSRSAANIVLRLDATDDHLLDIAAQMARVSVRRGAALSGGKGITARVISQERTFA